MEVAVRSDWVLVDEIEQRSIGKLLWSIID